MPIPTSLPISSPPSAPTWKVWWRTPATRPCSARLALRYLTRPDRVRPPGSPTGWAGPRASATRANCAPSRTTRSCNRSAGAPIRCKASARPLPATPRRSPNCGRTAAVSSVQWIWRATGLAHSDIEVLRAVIATLRSGNLAGSRRPHETPGAAGGTGRGGQSAGTAGHLGRRPVDVPPDLRRPSGTAGRLAGRAAHGEPGNPAARAAVGADPPDLAAGDRDSRLLAASRGNAAGAGGRDTAPGYRRLAEHAGGDFSSATDPAADCDYGEPAPNRRSAAYVREHEEIFAPMRRLFAMVREIATAVTHEVGAFG